MNENIPELLEAIATEMCDKYCKFPTMPVPEGKDEDWLMDEDGPCNGCPLNRLT